MNPRLDILLTGTNNPIVPAAANNIPFAFDAQSSSVLVRTPQTMIMADLGYPDDRDKLLASTISPSPINSLLHLMPETFQAKMENFKVRYVSTSDIIISSSENPSLGQKFICSLHTAYINSAVEMSYKKRLVLDCKIL